MIHFPEPPPTKSERPAATTLAAAAVMFGLCALFVVISLNLWTSAGRVRAENPFGAWEGDSFTMRLTAVVLFGLTALIAVCGWATLKGMPWGRDAALYLFTLFFVGSVFSAVLALTADTSARFWWTLAGMTASQLTVIALLSSPPTRAQFWEYELADVHSRRNRRARIMQRDLERRRQALVRRTERRRAREELRNGGSADVVRLLGREEREEARRSRGP